MGNYITKLKSSINLNYFKTKFEQNRGKKRKHNFLNSTELSENNEFPEEEEEGEEEEDDDDDDEEDEEIEDDDIEVDNDFIVPSSTATTSNSIIDNSTSNYRNIFARTNISLPNSSNRLTASSFRLRRRRRRTDVAKLMRNTSLIHLSLSSGAAASSNLIATKTQSTPSKMSSIDAKLLTPARKKMKSTTQYVYSTLFLNGENSDLIIRALNKDWHLHKIYLCQSPYFDSMFKNGSKWKESNQKLIEISIPDKNITEKSLFTAFGSFYKEDIEIVPLEVTSVLACASLLSLDGLIAQCETVMIENINHKSVFSYYEASIIYGVKSVTEATLKWLCYNVMSNNEICLSDIKPQLFEKIISSNDLMIVQVETDLYTLCKKWLYFQLNKSTKTLDKNWQKICNDFFKSFLNNDLQITENEPDNQETTTSQVDLTALTSSFNKKEECILDLPTFSKYVNIFKKIRLQHILTDMGSLNVLYTDRIIPHEWIEPYYFKNWLSTIYIDQDQLSHEFETNRDEFDMDCARFGRILKGESDLATWRWAGFNYGIDILLTHKNRTITIKRNLNYSSDIYRGYRGLLSNKPTQRIYYIMKVIHLDKFGNEKYSKETEFTCLDLNRSVEDKFVLNIDSIAKYPVLLNFRLTTHPFRAKNLILASNSTSSI